MTQRLQIQTIERIGLSVRRTVKRWANDNPFISLDDMMGACAITSYTLWMILKELGCQQAKLVCLEDHHCSGHCYVEYAGHIIDVTATQFDPTLPSVYVCEISKKSQHDFYRMPKSYHDNQAVERIKTWIDDQQPERYETKIARYVTRIVNEMNNFKQMHNN